MHTHVYVIRTKTQTNSVSHTYTVKHTSYKVVTLCETAYTQAYTQTETSTQVMDTRTHMNWACWGHWLWLVVNWTQLTWNSAMTTSTTWWSQHLSQRLNHLTTQSLLSPQIGSKPSIVSHQQETKLIQCLTHNSPGLPVFTYDFTNHQTLQ